MRAEEYLYYNIQDEVKPFISIKIGFKANKSMIHTTFIIDCGAMANFISDKFITSLGIFLNNELSPTVRDINNKTITLAFNNSIYYTHICIQGQDSPNKVCFRSISMAEHHVILGLLWLWAVNPHINFSMSTVTIP